MRYEKSDTKSIRRMQSSYLWKNYLVYDVWISVASKKTIIHTKRFMKPIRDGLMHKLLFLCTCCNINWYANQSNNWPLSESSSPCNCMGLHVDTKSLLSRYINYRNLLVNSLHSSVVVSKNLWRVAQVARVVDN